MESWRPIPGWPEYEYSPMDGGQVRSVDRVLPGGRRIGGVMLAQTADRKGYRRVTLCRGGTRRTVRVHVIAALVLLEERPPGHQVLHRGDDKSRNDHTLRYGTPQENVRERTRRERKKGKRGRKSRINSEGERGASRGLSNSDLGIRRPGP